MRASKIPRLLLLIMFFLILAGSCKKNKPPACQIIEPVDGSVFNIRDVIDLFFKKAVVSAEVIIIGGTSGILLD